MSDVKVFRELDSNCGPLVSEATALPTEPHPLTRLRKVTDYKAQHISTNTSIRVINERLAKDRYLIH